MSRALQPYAISSGLSLGLALANGLGLLAMPLILPAMMLDLDWGFRHGGFLASAAPAGLAVGLVLTAASVGAVRPARLFQLGLIVATAALIATGASRDVYALGILRFVCGLATAPVILCGVTLASSIFVYAPDRERQVVAVFRAGTAIGIVVGGAVVPLLLRTLGAKGWPEVWLTMGLLASASIPFVCWASQRIVVLPQRAMPAQWPWQRYMTILAAYALFAVGLQMLLTFLVLHAQMLGADAVAIAAMWMTLGLAAILSPLFWRALLPMLPAGQKISAAIGLTGLGALAVVTAASPTVLVVAAVPLGLGGFMAHVMLTELMHETLPREHWSRAFSAVLVLAASGQTVGAMSAGHLAAHTGRLTEPMALGTALLVVASFLALLPSRPKQPAISAQAHPAQPS